MEKFRIYGTGPFGVTVIHGGPGTPGEMAPVAGELSKFCGVLEPLQSVESIDGQLDELREVLTKNGDLPVAMIGHSWGAWLSFIFAANYPSTVKKLILVGSGPFESRYVPKIMEARLSRLNEKDVEEFNRLMTGIGDGANALSCENFKRLGRLIKIVDSMELLPYEDEIIEYQCDIYKSIWPTAQELRRTGKLLEFGKRIRCPVIAIHGDADPHPYEGVKIPLETVLKNFRFFLLSNCGHIP